MRALLVALLVVVSSSASAQRVIQAPSDSTIKKIAYLKKGAEAMLGLCPKLIVNDQDKQAACIRDARYLVEKITLSYAEYLYVSLMKDIDSTVVQEAYWAGAINFKQFDATLLDFKATYPIVFSMATAPLGLPI